MSLIGALGFNRAFVISRLMRQSLPRLTKAAGRPVFVAINLLLRAERRGGGERRESQPKRHRNLQ